MEIYSVSMTIKSSNEVIDKYFAEKKASKWGKPHTGREIRKCFIDGWPQHNHRFIREQAEKNKLSQSIKEALFEV